MYVANGKLVYCSQDKYEVVGATCCGADFEHFLRTAIRNHIQIFKDPMHP